MPCNDDGGRIFAMSNEVRLRRNGGGISSASRWPCLTRRRFLCRAAVASVGAILAACGQEPSATTVDPTVSDTPAPTRVIAIATPLPTTTPMRPVAVGPVDLISVLTTGLTTPIGVTVDAQLNLYVIDNLSRLHKFAPNGQLIVEWGRRGSGDGELSLNDALILGNNIATDAQGNVYVPDTGNARIQKFDSNGQILSSWGSRGTADGQLNFPHGVAIEPNGGRVYVADTNNHRVQIFDPVGAFMTILAMPRDMPVAVTTDEQGNVIVLDPNTPHIQRFDPTGQRLAAWGGPGTGDGEFSRPVSCAVDAHGSIYIADTGNHRIQQFDRTGTFMAQWGEQGRGDGQFQLPSGIAIDRRGDIFVADTGNNRVLKFHQRSSA